MLEQVVHGSLFDDLTRVHHGHAVAQVRDDTEIVGHEQHRHAELLLQRPQQVQDLCLDGHVERRRGLVGDEQLRSVGQRDRDHHPLAESARKLVRVLAQPGFGRGNADEVEQLDGALARISARHVVVKSLGLDEEAADRKSGIEARHRVLEDHADLLAADGAHLRERQGEQVAAVEPDVPVHDASRR